MLAVGLAVFLWARTDHATGVARALTFTTLVSAFLGVILVHRSRRQGLLATLRTPNPASRWVVAGTTATLTLVLTIPWTQHLFHFAPVHPKDLFLSVLAGLASVAIWPVLRAVVRRVGRREGARSPSAPDQHPRR